MRVCVPNGRCPLQTPIIIISSSISLKCRRLWVLFCSLVLGMSEGFMGMRQLINGRKEMFYLMRHSTGFIYGYMASDIW